MMTLVLIPTSNERENLPPLVAGALARLRPDGMVSGGDSFQAEVTSRPASLCHRSVAFIERRGGAPKRSWRIMFEKGSAP
jgi:hypothetical protein